MDSGEECAFMIWCKHYTSASSDPKIARLIADEGLAGYGAWWLVVETVARQVGDTTISEVTYPLSSWTHFLFLTDPVKTKKLLEKLHQVGLIVLSGNDPLIKVSIPNIVKLRDEYSRKKEKLRTLSGQHPDSLRSLSVPEVEVEVEVEVDTDKDKTLRAFEVMRTLWNTEATKHGWATCREITPSRRKHFLKRCEHPKFLESIPKVIQMMGESPFFLEKWSPSIDFLLERADKWIKVLEGAYGQSATPPPGTGSLKPL